MNFHQIYASLGWLMLMIVCLSNGMSQSISFSPEPPMYFCEGDTFVISAEITRGGKDFTSFNWKYINSTTSGSGTVLVDADDSVIGASGSLVGETSSVFTLSLTVNNAQSWLDATKFRLSLTPTNGSPNTFNDTRRIFISSAPTTLDSITTNPVGREICEGESIELFVSESDPNAGPKSDIKWYDGNPSSGGTFLGSGESIPVSSAGTYYARREACNDSSNTIEVTISETPKSEQITDITASSTLICPGGSTTLTANGGKEAGGRVEWYSDADATQKINEGRTYSYVDNSGTTTTIYAKIVSDSDCIDEDVLQEITIDVYGRPDELNSMTIDPSSICRGERIDLEARGGSTESFENIFWYIDTAGNSFDQGEMIMRQPDNSTTYFARRENTVCENLASDFVDNSVVVTEGISAMIDPFDETICIGGSADFSTAFTSPNATYLWEFDMSAMPSTISEQGPFPVQFPEAGTFPIRLSIQDGPCSLEILDSIHVLAIPEVEITSNNLLFDPPNTFIVSEQATVRLEFSTDQQNVSYSWIIRQLDGDLVDDLPLDGDEDILQVSWTFITQEEGNEANLQGEVTVMNEACSVTEEFFLHLQQLMFVPNLLTPNGDGVNDTWDIRFAGNQSEESDYLIQLYNRQGICVYGCQQSVSITDARFWDGSGIPDGPYFYLMSNRNDSNFHKEGSLTIVR
ncbi:MAG: gliding motility-associated C-terminal domain-containing protein [Bacteroidota bacterium]